MNVWKNMSSSRIEFGVEHPKCRGWVEREFVNCDCQYGEVQGLLYKMYCFGVSGRFFLKKANTEFGQTNFGQFWPKFLR